MRHLPCLFALLIATPAASWSAPAYAPRQLTAAEAGADVALLRRGLETIHPGLYRYTPKPAIDAAFARLESAAAAPIDELALHRAIALMLAEIHCDHTKAELSDAMSAWRETNPSHLPFRFRLIEGRMIVVSNTGAATAPPVGSEILAINDQPVPKLLLTLAATVAYDGSTDQAIAVKLADDSDLTGDDFDENYPSFFGLPDAWQLAWKRPGALAATQTTLAPISFAAWKRLESPDGAFRAEFYNSIHWRLAGKVARLSIGTFVNYRNPVNATAFLGGFFRAMQAAGTEHLILDLRQNGGGSEDVSVALGRYLFDKPFLWSKPLRLKAIRIGDLAGHIDSWGDRDALFNPPEAAFVRSSDGGYDRIPDAAGDERDDDNSTIVHQPATEARFTGRLTVLTGPANASGATRAIAQLQDKRAVTLVGEDSSGSAEGPTAGNVLLMTLPHSGLKVRIANAWNRTAIAKFTPGRGVAADILVVPTLADFETGRDRAMAIARMPAPAVKDAAAMLAAVTDGLWAGTLDYRDYGDDSRAVLPTRMQAAGLRFAFTYDDGPGKTVTGSESWTVSGDTLTIADGKRQSRHHIAEFHADDKGATLVFDGTSRENGRDVLTRTIVTRSGDVLRMTEMSRLPGQPFLMRHSHQLQKIAGL